MDLLILTHRQILGVNRKGRHGWRRRIPIGIPVSQKTLVVRHIMGQKYVTRLVILTLVSPKWDGIFPVKPQWIIAE